MGDLGIVLDVCYVNDVGLLHRLVDLHNLGAANA